MICFKTGCAVFFENEHLWLDSADLHCIGDVVVIKSSHYTYDADDLIHGQLMSVLPQADSLVVQYDPDNKRAYAVVLQEDCVISPELAAHYDEYYPDCRFKFRREATPTAI